MKCIASFASLTVLLGFASIAAANPEGGTIVGVNQVSGYSVNVHRILYRGGEQADFAIVGDGTTTLNVIVRDAAGNEVCRTSGPGDRCQVLFRPGQTGFYYISVVNEGSVFNRYAYKAW
jgi:hypothetical protein